MSKRVRGTTREIDVAARQLRQSMTEAEQMLWQRLRAGQLAGLKFRRQHPVGRFVLDFVCLSSRLVVELDGPVHDGRREQDAVRDQHLSAYGYRVLRFRNEEVLDGLQQVLALIQEAAASRAPDLNPSPNGWGRGKGRGPQPPIPRPLTPDSPRGAP